MLRSSLSAALVALTSIGAAAFVAPALDGPAIGSPAPEIDAKTWFNHVGRPLSLENLRGKAVMLEFWATWCGPCVAAWPHVQEIQDEYGPKGLVVLALSSEDEAKVAEFLDQNGYTARTAAGTTSGGAYGVSGIPRTFLIDPEGRVAWTGHPSGLSKGLLDEVVKTARKGVLNPLEVPIATEATGRVAAHVKAAAAGNPGKALAALQTIAADAKATAEEQSGAEAAVAAIQEHASVLAREGDRLIAARDVLRGLAIHEMLAKEFAGPIGDAAKQRVAEVRKDADSAKEIAGAEALERAIEQGKKLSTSKAKAKYEEVVEKHRGTRAAERAAALLRKKG